MHASCVDVPGKPSVQIWGKQVPMLRPGSVHNSNRTWAEHACQKTEQI